MGLFKSMKDMKNMVHEAPDLIAQSTQLAENAKAQAAAQEAMSAQAMAAMAAPVAPVAPAGMPAAATAGAESGVFAPINGVTIELFAEISKSFAEVGYDQTKGPELAARKGVAAADWEAAVNGWNARMQSDPAVGQRFNALYMGR
ncbi:MAG: hypothetical protein JWM89_3397 [Acidimicrobiales bacterium]|nr:hypothetical protein [Acidimicrobiales bacterium]